MNRIDSSQASRAGPVPGSDHEAEVEVSVEEAYHGTERSFTITGPDGPRTLDVTIPAGVVDGQRIRLRGQGGPGGGSAAAGDLYLVVRIADHPRYRAPSQNDLGSFNAPADPQFGTQPLPYLGPFKVGEGAKYTPSASRRR